MVGQAPRQRSAPDGDVFAEPVTDEEVPKRQPFIAVDVALFDYIEDGRLTPTAALVYIALLRHHNGKRQDDSVWPSRKALAKAVGIQKLDNVDRHLKALKDVGLISWTARSVGKMKASNRYELHLIADTRRSEEVPPPAGYRAPSDGGGVPPQAGYELDTEELPEDEQDPTKESIRTAPPTFASLSTAAVAEEISTDVDRGWAERDRKDDGEDWRKADRERFMAHLDGCEKISSWGHRPWNKGVFSAAAFYNAFRTTLKTPIKWPGQFFDHLAETRGETAVEDWLLDQGLELKRG